MYKEIIWFTALLIMFLILLVLIGSPNVSDLTIITASYILNWVILRFCVIRFGEEATDSNSYEIEIIWFGTILTIFLAFLILVGSPTNIEFVIVISAFTFIWIVRSYIFKRFQS